MFSIWVFCRGYPVRHIAKAFATRADAEAALTAMFPFVVGPSTHTGEPWVRLGQFEAFITEAGTL